MPKRSNEFQKLVHLVHKNLAGNATVTESKMLRDRVTSDEKEVDVYIESTLAGQNLVVCIECRDHGRKADRPWVESMKAKHERLSTNQLILASRNGFTAAALRSASSYGISAISLIEKELDNFDHEWKRLTALWCRQFSLRPSKVVAQIEATNEFEDERIRLDPDHIIYRDNGKPIGIVSELVTAYCNEPNVRLKILNDAKIEHHYVQLGWRLKPNDGDCLYLKKIEPMHLRRISEIQITASLIFDTSKINMKLCDLGSQPVAWGFVTIHETNSIVVASNDDSGAIKFAVQKNK